MDAVRAHLVRRDAQLVLLLTPPFDRMAHDPGYIKGYLPGMRENGGQYTHAALWTVIALAQAGTRRRSDGTVPHAQPDQPHAHAGGASSDIAPSRTWSRPTSTRIRCMSAAAGGRGTRVRPGGCIRRRSRDCSACAARRDVQRGPVYSGDLAQVLARVAGWPRALSHHGLNPEHRCRGVTSAELDGTQVDPRAIPLLADDSTHEVSVVLGKRGVEDQHTSTS